MSRLWLVRHGTADSEPGLAIGSSDPPLSAGGLEQAQKLASELARRPLGQVVSSDLRRASATAEAIARPHGLRVVLTPALREIDFGVWEGRSLAEFWRESPEQALAWERDLRATPPGFGERFADLERRVLEFWRQLPEIGLETAVVAHRGSLVVLLAAITGAPLEDAWQCAFEPGTATPVEAD